MPFEPKENLIVVLDDFNANDRYYLEVYARRSECETIAKSNCRNLYPDTVDHLLVCVRVASQFQEPYKQGSFSTKKTHDIMRGLEVLSKTF